MAASEGIHYSIWVSPPPTSEISEEVFKLERDAHKACPAMTEATFQPHITIVGSFMAANDEMAKARARELAMQATTGPFMVEFDAVPSVVEADKWNMVVVFWIDDNHSHLLALHKAFGGSGKEYTPHMSLCYGCSSKEEREDLAEVMAKSTTLSGRCRFDVDSVELWRTEGILGGVAGWKRIDRIAL